MPPPAAPAPSNTAGDEFAPEREVIYENTYITKPEGYGTVRGGLTHAQGPHNASSAI